MKRNPAYLVIALFFVGIVTWGFWQSYFGPVLQGIVERPLIVHIHAVVFVGWVTLLVAQAALVTTGRVSLHRRIGTAGMVYGAFVFLVGVLVSIGAFLAFAFANRTRSEVHKRWVIAATAPMWQDLGRTLLGPFV